MSIKLIKEEHPITAQPFHEKILYFLKSLIFMSKLSL